MAETRKLRNVGIAEMFIPFGPFEGVSVPQGEVADVPDVIAVSLLEQPSNWEAADEEPEVDPESRKARSAPKAAAKKDGDE